jgi:hypothetical protein
VEWLRTEEILKAMIRYAHRAYPFWPLGRLFVVSVIVAAAHAVLDVVVHDEVEFLVRKALLPCQDEPV